MRLGIGSWTFPWGIGFNGYPKAGESLTAIDLLYKAKSLGVEIVQICDNMPLHEMSDSELRQLGRKADEMDLFLQVGTQGVDPEHLLRYLGIAKILKSNILRIITDTSECKPEAEAVVKQIKEVIPEFAKNGVFIAVENHDRFKVRELKDIIRKIGSPFAGICLDTVNSFGELECPREVVSELGPYVVNLHIKDFDISRIDNKMGFNIKGSPAGYGKLDIDMVFKELINNGRYPDVILEQWVPFEGTVEKSIQLENEWAEKGVKLLKEKIKLSNKIIKGENQNEAC
jgi:sugar phosphate isomerase/epimerase